jgi:hypothetical protein
MIEIKNQKGSYSITIPPQIRAFFRKEKIAKMECEAQ